MKANIKLIALLLGTVFAGNVLNAQTTVKGKVFSRTDEPLVGVYRPVRDEMLVATQFSTNILSLTGQGGGVYRPVRDEMLVATQ
jgi:hypothetical protein